MRVILLAAGFATRMYPLTKDVPKALLEVAGKKVIDYVFDELLEFSSLEQITIVTNAKFYAQMSSWASGQQKAVEEKGIRLEILNDEVESNETRLGAVGDLAFVLDRTDGYHHKTMVLAADNIFAFPLIPLWEMFRNNVRNYILALEEKDLARRKRSGVLVLGEDQRVLRLEEKPESPSSLFLCPPVYFFLPAALRQVRAFHKLEPALDAPGHFVSYLVQQEPVFALHPDGRRYDIGSLEDFAVAEQALFGLLE